MLWFSSDRITRTDTSVIAGNNNNICWRVKFYIGKSPCRCFCLLFIRARRFVRVSSPTDPYGYISDPWGFLFFFYFFTVLLFCGRQRLIDAVPPSCSHACIRSIECTHYPLVSLSLHVHQIAFGLRIIILPGQTCSDPLPRIGTVQSLHRLFNGF